MKARVLAVVMIVVAIGLHLYGARELGTFELDPVFETTTIHSPWWAHVVASSLWRWGIPLAVAAGALGLSTRAPQPNWKWLALASTALVVGLVTFYLGVFG